MLCSHKYTFLFLACARLGFSGRGFRPPVLCTPDAQRSAESPPKPRILPATQTPASQIPWDSLVVFFGEKIHVSTSVWPPLLTVILRYHLPNDPQSGFCGTRRVSLINLHNRFGGHRVQFPLCSVRVLCSLVHISCAFGCFTLLRNAHTKLYGIYSLCDI